MAIAFCDHHEPGCYVAYDPTKHTAGCPVCHPETKAQEDQDHA